MAGRLEGWKAGRVGRLENFPDVFKLGGPGSMLLDLVQMTCLSCLNVRVCKKGAVICT